LLDEAMMISKKYNVKKIEIEIALKANTIAEVKLLTLCRSVFKIDTFYTNEFISIKLNQFYQKLGIVDPKTGIIKVAKPSDLGQEGRFNIKKGKRLINGKNTHGYWIKFYSLGVKTLD